MKKLLLFLLITMFIFPLNLSALPYHDLPNITRQTIGSVLITPRTIDSERVRGVTVNGIVPEITGSDTLDERIAEIIDAKTGNGTGTVELSYKIVRANVDRGEVISLIFTAEAVTPGGSRSGRISTLVLERDTMEEVSAADLLGGNGLMIATDVVNNFIAQNFRNMPRVSALDESSYFYVTGEAVYFVFDRYEIAPGSEGIQSVPVYFDDLITYVLLEDDFHINVENHGVRMLPLRRLSEHFGFSVSWNVDYENFTQEIMLTRASDNGNGNGAITLRLGENAYRRMHDITPRALEAAPEVIDGNTFVPISFFEAILDIHYNILADGTIELATYRG